MTTQKKMNNTAWMFLCAAIFGLIVLAAYASAVPTGPTVLNNISSSRNNLSFVPRTTLAEAGNVSEVNVTANSITKAWQGYFGNITGQIVLQDSLGNNFYTWNNSLVRGEIYASRSAAVSWSTINCTNSTGMNQENAYLGNKPSTDADSLNNTFTSTSHPAITVGSTTLSNCWSTRAYSGTAQTGSNFWNILLSDSGGNGSIVYTAFINESTTSFRGGTTDFELLVGENGNATNTAPTTYYFYVELD